MTNKLQINISDKPKKEGIVSCKKYTIREKLLKFVFGERRGYIVLMPSENLDELVISKRQSERE